MGKTLVAYFSRKGHTKRLAEQIHSMLEGSDLFEIKTVKSYPKNYFATVFAVRREMKAGKELTLSTHIKDMDSYDRIIIGYPIWFGTIPMALSAFFKEYDFSGKTVAPFATYGGSGIEKSEADVKTNLPQSRVLKGFGYGGFSKGNVDTWIKDVLNG